VYSPLRSCGRNFSSSVPNLTDTEVKNCGNRYNINLHLDLHWLNYILIRATGTENPAYFSGYALLQITKKNLLLQEIIGW